ncbi:MAG: nif-specific transcriptional activator NifA [Nitrospirae bacterium]|nr:nif-specific transcriptional activator NifA [Nitrospirota bacterium]
MDKRSLELNALYEISKILGSSLNLDKTLKNAMKVLSMFLDMKRGTVALKDDNELVIKAAHGLTLDEIKLGRYKLGEGIMGQVAKSGYPIVIPNVGDEPLFLNKTGSRLDIDKENIAFLCVPILFKTEILGVLSVDRLFSSATISLDEDLRLLKIIASLIGQSVQLSRKVEQERLELIAQREALKIELKGRYRIKNIVGSSNVMQEVYESVYRVSPSKATVLLMGESGTGKELIARAIHYMGPRADEPFVKFNCASIPEGLLETELFGHEKGAFTGAANARKGRFELANRGTIFLDEIADLTLSLQPKILRVLQEREFERIGGEKTIKVDVRVIAATSRDLENLVAERQFREDLFYRLNVVPIFMPPLRNRKDDIIDLVEHFLDKFNKENLRDIKLTRDAVNVMVAYSWPGNVRELENTIERIVIMSPEEVVKPEDLPLNIREPRLIECVKAEGIKINGAKAESLKAGTAHEAETAPASQPQGQSTTTLSQVERTQIIEALSKANWVHAKAAKLLGITPRQIGYKVKKYGIRQDIS